MSAPRPYTQVKRAQARDRTRTALLDAAKAAFFTGRWEQVSLEAIAAAAGVTKQTLLRHFGSKAALLEAAFARGFEQVGSQRLAAPTDDIDGAVANLLDHYEQRGEEGLRIAAMEGGGGIAALVQRARGLHYDWVGHAFGAWLDRAPRTERSRLRAALIVLCDVHAWQILSRDLGLARAEVHSTLVLAIRRLLEEDT
jgi:AcrR family transcriptional regulator